MIKTNILTIKNISKNYRYPIMKFLLILSALSMMCVGCHYVNKALGLKDDNVIEEALEDILKHHTGIDIDLTPEEEQI